MQSNGIRSDQITQVRGFADQRLRKKENPLDPANRRISLIVQYLNKPEPPLSVAGTPQEKPGKKAGEKSADGTGDKKTDTPEAPEKAAAQSEEKKRTEGWPA